MNNLEFQAVVHLPLFRIRLYLLLSPHSDTRQPHPHLPKHFPHRLLRQLHPQKRRRISRNRPGHRWREARKKRPIPSLRPQRSKRAPNRAPLRTLQPTLQRVNRKHRNPHRHTRRTTCRHDSRQTQIPARLPIRIQRRQPSLDKFVRREIRRGSGPIPRQRHCAPAKHAAQPAGLIQLPHHVHLARVFWLLAWREGFLALDLEEDFDALEGGGYEGLRDGGEETGGGELADGEAGGGDGGEGADEAFAEVVAPEGYGD